MFLSLLFFLSTLAQSHRSPKLPNTPQTQEGPIKKRPQASYVPGLPSLLAQRPRDLVPDLMPNILTPSCFEPLVQPLAPVLLTLSPHHSLHPSLPPAPCPLAPNHSHRHITHYPANAPYLAQVPSPMPVNYPSNHDHSFKTRHPPYKNPKITRLLGMVFLLEIYS